VAKKNFPIVHYYDQDFVDIYDKTWAWLEDFWAKGDESLGFEKNFFLYPETNEINQFESCFATFFLVYSNRMYPPMPLLDNFYSRQEENGAIRGRYNTETGEPILTPENPEGVMPPLFAWAEYNLYHKVGQKKRLKEVMPILEKHYMWLEETFRDDTGMYSVPLEATIMENSPREGMKYPLDFNTQMAINALYMSALGDILNDKEISFHYKRRYFSLKTRINSRMWNEEQGFYFDLDDQGNQLTTKTIAAYWTLLAELPNEERFETLVDHLKNDKTFGLPNPFPSLSADDPHFDPKGNGYRGGVFTPFTFMVIKGLEKYERYDFAREVAIRHLYYILDTLHPDGEKKGTLWEAYDPMKEGQASWEDRPNREKYLGYTSLGTITLMIENIVGLYISLPRKTVDWIVPTLELMGIEDLELKRNMITIQSNKSGRGWEIRLESEKLYYFTINILGQKKKTLPIPSGKCSMLIDKL